MNSPSDDDMFSRYRTELVMDAEARARTFRKLQERVLQGEQPVPEIDVVPPHTAAPRGLWSLPAKWVVTIAGLGVGALIVANVVLRGTPLTAADEVRVMVAQPAADKDEAALSGSALAGSEAAPGAVVRAEDAGEASLRAQAQSAARSNRTANAAPATVPQLTAAPRSREAGSTLSVASRAQEQRSQLTAAARVREAASSQVGGQSTAAARAQMASAPLAADHALQAAPSGATQPPSVEIDAAAKQQKQAYTAPKVPQRSDKEIASETLTKEVQLLQAAQLALRAGDTQRSLALLAEHTWTYPRGHLAEARDVARILALCQAGNAAQSQLHAKRFLQQRPESPYALRVRAGCAAMTESQEPHSEPTP